GWTVQDASRLPKQLGSSPSFGVRQASGALATGAACVYGCLISVFPCPPKSDEGGSFASAAAISSQDGALQACHGGPARITLPSALHLGTPHGTESAPARVSSS